MRKYKWQLYWSGFFILLAIFVTFVVLYNCLSSDYTDGVGIGIETSGSVMGVYLSLVIFLKSQDAAEFSNRRHMEHLRDMHDNQIQVLKDSNEAQIKELRIATQMQMDVILKASQLQIEAINKSNSEKAVKLVLKQGELNKRKKSLLKKLKEAREEYDEINEFQFFRRASTKKIQLDGKSREIQSMTGQLDDLNRQLEELVD